MRFLFFSTTPGVPGKAGDGISDGGMIKHHSTLNRSFDQSVCYNIKNYQTKKWIRHFPYVSVTFLYVMLYILAALMLHFMLYSKYFWIKIEQMILNKKILPNCLDSVMSKKDWLKKTL